jgi:hypothetical protein
MVHKFSFVLYVNWSTRSGKNSTHGPAEGLHEQLQLELENVLVELSSAQQDLATERAQSKNRHSNLVETLTSALQARDAALGALKRLEQFCVDNELDITGLAIYEVSCFGLCTNNLFSILPFFEKFSSFINFFGYLAFSVFFF